MASTSTNWPGTWPPRPFAITERLPGTLNGVFSATRVQFLHADEGRPQHLLEPPVRVDGLHVAELSDLMAMKLKVVGDRGELRDYFDLMIIEQRTGRTADEGLALFVERFRPEYPGRRSTISCSASDTSTTWIPTTHCRSRAQIVDYWTRRQPEIVAARGRLHPRPVRRRHPGGEPSLTGLTSARRWWAAPAARTRPT